MGAEANLGDFCLGVIVRNGGLTASVSPARAKQRTTITSLFQEFRTSGFFDCRRQASKPKTATTVIRQNRQGTESEKQETKTDSHARFTYSLNQPSTHTVLRDNLYPTVRRLPLNHSQLPALQALSNSLHKHSNLSTPQHINQPKLQQQAKQQNSSFSRGKYNNRQYTYIKLYQSYNE